MPVLVPAKAGSTDMIVGPAPAPSETRGMDAALERIRDEAVSTGTMSENMRRAFDGIAEQAVRRVHDEVAALSQAPSGAYAAPQIRWVLCDKLCKRKDGAASTDWECCRLRRMVGLSPWREIFQVRSAVSDPRRPGRGVALNDRIAHSTICLAEMLLRRLVDPERVRDAIVLLGECDAVREQELREASQEGIAGWRAWARDAVRLGGRAAHAYVRRADAHEPGATQLGHPDGPARAAYGVERAVVTNWARDNCLVGQPNGGPRMGACRSTASGG